MQKLKFKETVIREDRKSDGENEYTYKLIMRKGSRLASYKITLYSIKAEMTTQAGETTAACVKDIFADLRIASSFYEKIVNGLATPIDLKYIMEDEILR